MRIVHFSLLLVLGNQVWAACPHPTPKFCSGYFESDKVFIGEFISKDFFPPVEGPHELEGWFHRYKFRVLKTLKGQTAETETILSENASARWVGDLGKAYVIFARNGMTGGNCGPLDEPEYVEKVFDDLNAVSNAMFSTVEGNVVIAKDRMPSAGPGVHVQLYGPDSTLETLTDSDGNFVFSVTPGMYLVHIEGARNSGYSRNSYPIELARGQCAQYEFAIEEQIAE